MSPFCERIERSSAETSLVAPVPEYSRYILSTSELSVKEIVSFRTASSIVLFVRFCVLPAVVISFCIPAAVESFPQCTYAFPVPPSSFPG